MVNSMFMQACLEDFAKITFFKVYIAATAFCMCQYEGIKLSTLRIKQSKGPHSIDYGSKDLHFQHNIQLCFPDSSCRLEEIT